MSNLKHLRAFYPAEAVLCGAIGASAALLLAGAAVTLSQGQAQATPAYAAQTKQACGACHTNPAGGGNLTARGKAFQKSHK
jgi:mono/diheme cytochrome c family protein